METDDHNQNSKKIWWWCKSVTLPEVTVEPAEFQLTNTKIKIPTIATYGDLSVKFIVEANSKNRETPSLMKLLRLAKVDRTFGPAADDNKLTLTKYGYPDKNNLTYERVSLIDPSVMLLDAKGKIVNHIMFRGTFIKSINFGDLDYSSDDLMEFEIVMSVDSMEIR